MHRLKNITKHLTVNHIAELIMVAFAGLSLANVEAFFLKIHPHGIASWVAGIALGLILVVLAGMLARTETNFKDRGYLTLLLTTAGLAIISGLIQGAAYDETMRVWSAYALGLSLPLFGELFLALAVSEFNQAERKRKDKAEAETKRKAAENADADFEYRINQAVSEALTDIDVSAARKHIERKAAEIVRHQMDRIVEKRIGKIGSVTEAEAEESPVVADNPRPSIDVLNEARQSQVSERQHAIIELLSAYGAMSTAEIAEKLKEDRDISVSDRTVRSDCAELEGSEIAKDGRNWKVAQPIAAQLPELTAPILNGVNH